MFVTVSKSVLTECAPLNGALFFTAVMIRRKVLRPRVRACARAHAHTHVLFVCEKKYEKNLVFLGDIVYLCSAKGRDATRGDTTRSG